jgi:sRNA-binding protein
MRSTWPLAFTDPPRPLAIGTGAAIGRAHPAETSGKDIGRALAFWAGSDSYLEAIAAAGSRRINLDGSDAGEVEESHRVHARIRLAERMAARRAERKGAAS